MRTLSSASVVTAAAAASLLLAPAAYAIPNTLGDNGTVKIHDAVTDEELKKNEPKVCEFYLDAFNFDGLQEVLWKIVKMPPTGPKGEVVKEGALTLDVNGHGTDDATDPISLPDGHYKLEWTFEGAKGDGKHKVFWVDCGAEETVGKASAPSADASAPAAPEADASAPAAPEADASAPAGEEPQANLAETGSSTPAAALAAGAAALLGAGAYLVLRRRKAAAGSQD